jgi:uncharacterized phiE125 gp8 family phage protein
VRIKWAIRRVTDPAVEALTLAEAKAQLRVEHADDDTYIAGINQGGREWLEERTNRSFVLQTWDFFQDAFPNSSERFIELPRGPVITASTVKYTTTSATTAQELTATAWSLDNASEPARVWLREGQTWPTDELRKTNGVEVRYTAGFATSATGVPQRVKQALRLLVGNAYVNREAVVVGAQNQKLELAVDSLVAGLDRRRYL